MYTHERACMHMYTHVSKRINRREMIYLALGRGNASLAPFGQAGRSGRVANPSRLTANCKLRTQIKFKLFSKLHSRKDRDHSLMGIYWFYPLSNPSTPLECASVCVAVAFLGCFPFFTVWILHCISLLFLIFFIRIRISHCIFMVSFLSKHLWRHVFYAQRISLRVSFYCFDLFSHLYLTCAFWLIWRIALNLQ